MAKTVIDLERATVADLVALWKHCMRMVGQDDHIIKDQTKDNKWLIGNDKNFAHAMSEYIKNKNAKKDARNDKPATCLVLGASPEYFRPDYHRDDEKGFGKYDQKRLDDWVDATTKWLTKTFGDDCIAAHCHADERTCHIHAVIVPMNEKKPTMPRNKRANETQENFDKRVERAKKKKSKFVVSHHTHHLFGSGRKSYENVVDSYAAAVEHLGIERGERGSDSTSTTKQEYARNLLRKAEEKLKEAGVNVMAMKERQRIEDESFEFGTSAVIDDKLTYYGKGEINKKTKTEVTSDGLYPGANMPESKEEREDIKGKIQPAKSRITQFAKFVKELATKSFEDAKALIIKAHKQLMDKQAKMDAKEKELIEREKALGILEEFENAEMNDGAIDKATDEKLRGAPLRRNDEAPTLPPKRRGIKPDEPQR